MPNFTFQNVTLSRSDVGGRVGLVGKYHPLNPVQSTWYLLNYWPRVQAGSSHFQFDFLSGWHFPWFPQPPDCCDQTTSAGRKKYGPYIVSFVQEDAVTAVDFFSQLWSAAILVFIGASRVCNLHPNLRQHATHWVRRSPTCLNQSAGSWGINVLIQELAGKISRKA